MRKTRKHTGKEKHRRLPVKLVNNTTDAFIFLFKDFIYSFMREAETQAETQAELEKQAPCRELDMELNSRTQGSQPESKADIQPLSHPGVPEYVTLNLGS